MTYRKPNLKIKKKLKSFKSSLDFITNLVQKPNAQQEKHLLIQNNGRKR